MPDVIFVAGLARCGTSMTMQMLNAAGIPCVGTFPGFEVDDMNHRPISTQTMERYAGHAVKWINPHMAPAPAGSTFITLWLDRSSKEQARSQAKFTSMMMGIPTVGRSQLRRWASSLERDRPKALAALRGHPHIMLTFEGILADPKTHSLMIAEWLTPRINMALDVDAMAKAVLPRSAQCQPGLDIELSLVARAEANDGR